MLPKYHVLIGLIFAFSVWLVFSEIRFLDIGLIFFSSVLIDIDHYFIYVIRKKDLDLGKAYSWYIDMRQVYKEKSKKNPKLKFLPQIFHTLEFLILISVISLYSSFFFYILIGILFHSLVDIIELYSRKVLRAREFSLIRYIISDKKDYI